MTGEDKDFIRTQEVITGQIKSPTGILLQSLSPTATTMEKNLWMASGKAIKTGGDGFQVASAVDEKIGFYGATPAVKQEVAAGANVATLIAVLSGMGLLGDPATSA